ncbi:FeoA family protein [Phenylobacterium immobile]|uniref:FeoA family protein n=1 Tax=Phenylobacterium immobile TaxID=21 RepID=UPI000AAB06E0|nr:FeoA family protein [Phenylobacterium immobile]
MTELPGDVALRSLGSASPGDRGVIVEVRRETTQAHHDHEHGLDPAELERRLLEFGFVEGAHVEVLFEGAIGHDPIAVRLDDMRVALRRRDAAQIWLRMDEGQAR